jgi:hypothetical protein
VLCVGSHGGIFIRTRGKTMLLCVCVGFLVEEPKSQSDSGG